MDAQAYLMRHGWSGPGNPLNPNQRPGPHGGLGLTKPILVARKQNNHGVGKKTTKDPTNQWWLRGFEDALKGVGDESPSAVSAKTNNALTSELYRFFVRGEGLAGTLDREKMNATVEKSQSKSKRKRDSEEDVDRHARKEEKAARKEEKRKRRKIKEAEGSDLASSSGSVDKPTESKEERRLRRKEKKEKKARGADESTIVEEESKDSQKKERKTKRSAEEDYPTPMSTEHESEPARLKHKKGREGKSMNESKDKKKSESKKKSKKDNKDKS